MKKPGHYRWREAVILAAVPGSVLLEWLLLQAPGFNVLGNRWLLDWGIGAFFAVGVLGSFAWYRSLPWRWLLLTIALSIAAWHWAVQIASEGYDFNEPTTFRFLLRSTIAGFFGAVLVCATPLAQSRQPNWERRLAGIGAVGGFCGLQMAVLCIWHFNYGFWLGIIGWQLAVTLLLIYGTAPQRDGKPVFWPSPPQLN